MCTHRVLLHLPLYVAIRVDRPFAVGGGRVDSAILEDNLFATPLCPDHPLLSVRVENGLAPVEVDLLNLTTDVVNEQKVGTLAIINF